VLQTKEDCVLDGRAWEREEGAEELEVPDTLYADDTGEFFRLRAHAVQDVPRLVKFLARFGLFVHVKPPGQKKSKSVLLYHATPKASYTNFATSDDEDFDDVNGRRSCQLYSPLDARQGLADGNWLEALPVSAGATGEVAGGCSEWCRWAQAPGHCAALSRGWRH
jgi:hypothetical protein